DPIAGDRAGDQGVRAQDRPPQDPRGAVEIRHGVTRRRGITPALLTGLVAAASIGAFAAGGKVRRTDPADVRVVASAAAAAVSAHLAADGRLLAAVSEAIGGNPSRPDDELVTDMSRLTEPGQAMGI